MANLESLPAELKCMVLSALPDVRTLHSLVQASPDYYAVYRLNRQAILPSKVLPELRNRRINITPCHWAQFYLGGPAKASLHHFVKPAIEKCIASLLAGASTSFTMEENRIVSYLAGESVSLTFDESIALLSIRFFDPILILETMSRECHGQWWRAQRLKCGTPPPLVTKGKDLLRTRVSGWPLPPTVQQEMFERWYPDEFVTFEQWKGK